MFLKEVIMKNTVKLKNVLIVNMNYELFNSGYILKNWCFLVKICTLMSISRFVVLRHTGLRGLLSF